MTPSSATAVRNVGLWRRKTGRQLGSLCLKHNNAQSVPRREQRIVHSKASPCAALQGKGVITSTTTCTALSLIKVLTCVWYLSCVCSYIAILCATAMGPCHLLLWQSSCSPLERLEVAAVLRVGRHRSVPRSVYDGVLADLV